MEAEQRARKWEGRSPRTARPAAGRRGGTCARASNWGRGKKRARNVWRERQRSGEKSEEDLVLEVARFTHSLKYLCVFQVRVCLALQLVGSAVWGNGSGREPTSGKSSLALGRQTWELDCRMTPCQARWVSGCERTRLRSAGMGREQSVGAPWSHGDKWQQVLQLLGFARHRIPLKS